jgi:beta propeller repeat protein
MKKKWWIVAGSVTAILCLLVIIFNHQQTLYSNLFAPPVKAMNTIRRVIPGGPARYLSQDGDCIVGIGDVSFQNDDSALYLYNTNGTLANINDDTYTTIDVQDSGTICRSTVLGDYVTWLQTTEDCFTYVLKGYQISTQDSFTIHLSCYGKHYQRDGNYVVFSSANGSYVDISCYNLSTRINTVICSADEDQLCPDIHGNIVVWEDYRNEGFGDIYMYNLVTQQETPIENNENLYSRRPMTNGNVVVYETRYETDSSIYVYNLTTTTTTLLDDQCHLAFLWDINDSACVYTAAYDYNGVDENSLVLGDLTNTTTQIIENYDNWAWDVVLGSYQLVYNLTDEDFIMGDVYGYDLTTHTKYTIRNQGKTHCEININKSSDLFIMCSIGVGQEPKEWDVSLVQLP